MALLTFLNSVILLLLGPVTHATDLDAVSCVLDTVTYRISLCFEFTHCAVLSCYAHDKSAQNVGACSKYEPVWLFQTLLLTACSFGTFIFYENFVNWPTIANLKVPFFLTLMLKVQ